MTGSPQMDAERAFERASRRRRLSALARLLRGATAERLAVFDERRRAATPARGVREIPLDAITGTVEPARARLFDRWFRPAAAARSRWQRIWLAEHQGAALPPISVICVGDGYAVRDGHHRVSVAHARGALTIDAQVDALA